ncbi:MAG: hypothetical protein DWQ02_19115 [Bacteroidetes bacterium]|nr:MAG: hypothetical protein DWQ02_19115 [Bacteroidota bacterium]
MQEVKKAGKGKHILCLMFFVIGLVTTTLFGACKGVSGTSDKPYTDSTQTYSLVYDLESPELSLDLPGKLKEISGLDMGSSGDFVWAVQDEKGVIFKVSLKDGSILQEIPFWKDGDYEGIEKVGNELYVVKSTGTIYQIKAIGTPEQTMEKYNTLLEKQNDVEGLAYDAGQNCLLLACKGSSQIEGDSVVLEKAIYKFSLDSMKLDPVPAYIIKFEDVYNFVETTPTLRQFEKISEYFQPGETKFTFNPSGIAIHPLTGEIYILSATKRLLLIMTPSGEILHIEKMKKKMVPQPEGICFSSDGSLLISSEGKDGTASLHKFLMKQ